MNGTNIVWLFSPVYARTTLPQFGLKVKLLSWIQYYILEFKFIFFLGKLDIFGTPTDDFNLRAKVCTYGTLCAGVCRGVKELLCNDVNWLHTMSQYFKRVEILHTIIYYDVTKFG
jgi:hypothetical protein